MICVPNSWGHIDEETGSTERPAGKKRGRTSRYTPEVNAQIAAWIAQQPDLTLRELQIQVKEKWGLGASIGRLWSVLRELGLTLEKSRSMPPSRTHPRAKSLAFVGTRRPGKLTRVN